MSLDATKPTDSEAVSSIPEYMRETRAQVNENEAAIGGDYSRTVTSKNASEILDSTDFDKIITVSSSSVVTLTLPAVVASDKGSWIRVHKLGTGNVVITPNGADVIAAGSAGTAISNTESAEAKAAFIELEVTAAGQWSIAGILGTWG